MSLPATGGSLQPLEDRNPPERRFPAGFALVLVLCVLAVLSVIAVTLIRETREETRFEGAVIEDAKAEALAEGGIQQTMAELLTPPGNGSLGGRRQKPPDPPGRRRRGDPDRR